MMADFIYDKTDGSCVAHIEDGTVFNSQDVEIAKVKDGTIYGLNGQLIGHLASLTHEGPLPEDFKKLL